MHAAGYGRRRGQFLGLKEQYTAYVSSGLQMDANSKWRDIMSTKMRKNESFYHASGTSPTQTGSREWLSPGDVAAMTGIGINVLNRWASLYKTKGKVVGIPFRLVKIPGDRKSLRLYHVNAVKQFIREHVETEGGAA